MKDLFKYGALAIGAYLLAKEIGVFGGTQANGQQPASTGGSGTPPPATNTPPASNNPPPATNNTPPANTAPSLVDQLKARAGANALGYDGWGYYYREITGQAAPGPYAAGFGERTDPMPLITAEAFVAGVASAGGSV